MSVTRTEDEAAINAVLGAAYRAWEANDADAFVADYTEDATAILPGSLRAGREVIRETMVKGFEGPLKGSSTYNKQLSVRFLGDSAAIVVSESGILFAGESEVPDARKINATWVLEKKGGAWFIAAYHNCAMLAPAH
ncbi:SgcJ/EcaC family oxidoreductase [Kitasatospora sp. NPDC057500]|uniref:SgcJ/EcaC family oxidoreductase n=1 Tax=Kitasatospora sp. NPDC057500 TaxID=3346151 RepID=UPI0036AFA712